MKPLDADVRKKPQSWMNKGRLFLRVKSKYGNNLLIGDAVRISIERNPFRNS